MSNFEFIRDKHSDIYGKIFETESNYWMDIKHSSTILRSALNAYKNKINDTANFYKEIRIINLDTYESGFRDLKYYTREKFLGDFSNAEPHIDAVSKLTGRPFKYYFKLHILEKVLKEFHDEMVRFIKAEEPEFRHKFDPNKIPVGEFIIDDPLFNLPSQNYKKFYAHRNVHEKSGQQAYALIYIYPSNVARDENFIYRANQVQKILEEKGRKGTLSVGDLKSKDGHIFLIYLFKKKPLTLLHDKENLCSMGLHEKAKFCRAIALKFRDFHGVGIFHRNLTSNAVIMEDDDGEKIPTIIDFNLASISRPKETIINIYREEYRKFVSTEHNNKYFPKLNIDELSKTDFGKFDVYSLGVLFKDIFTDCSKDMQTEVKLEYLYSYLENEKKYATEIINGFKSSWEDILNGMCNEDIERRFSIERVITYLDKIFESGSGAKDTVTEDGSALVDSPSTGSSDSERHTEFTMGPDEGTGEDTVVTPRIDEEIPQDAILGDIDTRREIKATPSVTNDDSSKLKNLLSRVCRKFREAFSHGDNNLEKTAPREDVKIDGTNSMPKKKKQKSSEKPNSSHYNKNRKKRR
ncbi:MAG: protein kinase [Holosporaceae bacterium]|jgi:hypothetical protein|nr:protein kinase [Holosporaceae bacterium]